MEETCTRSHVHAQTHTLAHMPAKPHTTFPYIDKRHGHILSQAQVLSDQYQVISAGASGGYNPPRTFCTEGHPHVHSRLYCCSRGQGPNIEKVVHPDPNSSFFQPLALTYVSATHPSASVALTHPSVLGIAESVYICPQLMVIRGRHRDPEETSARHEVVDSMVVRALEMGPIAPTGWARTRRWVGKAQQTGEGCCIQAMDCLLARRAGAYGGEWASQGYRPTHHMGRSHGQLQWREYASRGQPACGRDEPLG